MTFPFLHPRYKDPRNMAWQSAFYGPCPFQPGREKIGTAGITKAKECAELVSVNGRERKGDEIAFAHHREGNGISELDNGLAAWMVVWRFLPEQLSRTCKAWH